MESKEDRAKRIQNLRLEIGSLSNQQLVLEVIETVERVSALRKEIEISKQESDAVRKRISELLAKKRVIPNSTPINPVKGEK